ALTSLALGFAVYLQPEQPWKLYLILAAAALCREGGFLLFAGYALHLLTLRRFRQLAIFATALIPALAWIVWVRAHVPGSSALHAQSMVPFSGMIDALLRPRHFAFSAPVVAVIRLLQWLRWAGILLSLALPFFDWRKLPADPIRTTCL